jgi:hypothetical protein
MRLEEVLPAHCHARARRLLAEVALIRDEMGRAEDTRPLPEVTDAKPREVYFEALATWHKVDRLASEVGAHTARFTQVTPPLRELRPGHVLAVIDGVLAHVDAIKQELHITDKAGEPAVENNRQPSDVLMTLVAVNRNLSRCLERPFAPSDVFHQVALASKYAVRLGATAEQAPFERRRKPRDCYEHLLGCLDRVGAVIRKRGESALGARGVPTDVLPGDVYDLASVVLGEVAFLHSLGKDVQPLHAFDPPPTGHRLPAHVDQLVRTLDAQLAQLA